MKILLNTLLILLFLSVQVVNAQGRKRNSNPSEKLETRFQPLTDEYINKTLDLLGIELGQTLAQIKNNVEARGGEVLWLGSPDQDFTLNDEQLKRGASNYFSYVIHSERKGKKNTSSLQKNRFSNNDVVLIIDVYPKAKGNFKSPENLILYRVFSNLTYQPSFHEVKYRDAKNIQVSFKDFHDKMEKRGHKLYQTGSQIVYKKHKGNSIEVGDLEASRSTWEKVLPRNGACNKLMSMSDKFPKKAATMIGLMNVSGSNNGFKPWREVINRGRQENFAQKYFDCGKSTVIQMNQVENPENKEKPLLNTVSMFYTDASMLEKAFEGFYNALYKD